MFRTQHILKFNDYFINKRINNKVYIYSICCLWSRVGEHMETHSCFKLECNYCKSHKDQHQYGFWFYFIGELDSKLTDPHKKSSGEVGKKSYFIAPFSGIFLKILSALRSSELVSHLLQILCLIPLTVTFISKSYFCPLSNYYFSYLKRVPFSLVPFFFFCSL